MAHIHGVSAARIGNKASNGPLTASCPRVRTAPPPLPFPCRFGLPALVPLLLTCGAALTDASGAVEAPPWFEWRQAAALPEGVLPESVRLAEGQGVLLLFGRTVDDASDRYWRLVGSVWEPAGSLPNGIHDATVIPSTAGVVCLAGQTTTGPSDRVFRVHRKPAATQMRLEDLPPLPAPSRGASGASLGSRVYVATPSSFWTLDLAAPPESRQWTRLPKPPGPARSAAAMAAQSNGERVCLFLFGGIDAQGRELQDAYRFDPSEGHWRELAPLPCPANLRCALPVGQAHIALFGRRLHGYHTITNVWTRPDNGGRDVLAATTGAGALAILSHPADRSASATGKPGPMVYQVSLLRAQRSLGPLDFAALAAYLGILVAVGCYFSRRENSTTQFFLGGQRIPWWAAGLSLLATQVSSIGFMAIPAKSFATDWAYIAGAATWFMVVPLVTAAYIPLFRRLNVTSAYEYLEVRFNLSVRLFGAVAYSFMQLGRMAVVLYLPALALASVTGLDHRACIVTMGVLCTAYTVAGGIEAVVWTDVVQAAVLLGGAVLCLIVVVSGIEGGAGRLLEVAAADGKFRFARFNPDITVASLWVILLGNVFIRLAGLTSDQAVVQRYLVTADAKQSNRALWADVAVSIPWALIAFLFGTALYVFYKMRPELLSPAVEIDGLVPLFVAQQLPAGVSGLIIAAIFAAAMSSLDSSMHSTATVWITDFYARFRPNSSDPTRLRLARWLTIVLGAFGTLTALALAQADIHSLWDVFQGLIGLFAGGLAGLFVLGLFTRRAHGTGALVGAVASAGFLYLAQPHIHFFLYPVVGVVGCVLIGYAASLILPSRPRVTRPPILASSDH